MKRSSTGPKAPFMEVLDTLSQSLSHSHSSSSNNPTANTDDTEADYRVLIDNYPHLMQCYEEDLKSIYTAAEEACCRIISHTLLPDLSDLPHSQNTSNSINEELPVQVKNSFFHAIKEMQSLGVPSVQRGALPKNAVVKFKQWFEINADYPYPSDEVKVALSNETGVAIAQISTWFTNHRKRIWKPNQGDDGESVPPALTAPDTPNSTSSPSDLTSNWTNFS